MELARERLLSFKDLMERAFREIKCEATNKEFVSKMTQLAEEKSDRGVHQQGGRTKELRSRRPEGTTTVATTKDISHMWADRGDCQEVPCKIKGGGRNRQGGHER